MPALPEPQAWDEEHRRMLVILRRLEGFTRPRTLASAPERSAERQREPIWSDLSVAEFFRRCQWE